MKYLLVTAVVLSLAGSAFAQSGFTPFVVNEGDLQQLDAMLLNNPPRVYQQVIDRWINGLETNARMAAQAAAEKSKSPVSAPAAAMAPKKKSP